MSSKHLPSQQGTNIKLTIVAALLAMLGPFSIDTYLPSFPAIEQEFSISRATLSQSLSVYLTVFGITTLVWGPMSDRIGRRLVILTSLIIYAFASIGCAYADNSTSFLIYRSLQGLGASGGFIAGRAMIRDAHSAEYAQKSMSQVMLLFALAPALAPIIGGWLQDISGWRSIFWFLTIFTVSLLILVQQTRETLSVNARQSFHPKYVWSIYLRTLKHSKFCAMSLSLSFSFGGLFLYIAGAPTVVYDFLGMGTKDFAVLFVPMVAGLMIGSFLSSQMATRWCTKRLVTLGFSLLIASVIGSLLLLMVFPISKTTVIAPLLIYTFGIAFIMPALTVMSLDCFPDNRGSAASMQGFIQMMTNALVASIAVPLLHNQVSHFVWGQLVFLLIATALWIFAAYSEPSTQGVKHA